MTDSFVQAYPPKLQPADRELSAFARGYAVREYKGGVPVGDWQFAVGKSSDTARKMAKRYEEMGMGDRLVIAVAFYPNGTIVPLDFPSSHDGIERRKGVYYVHEWDKLQDVLKKVWQDAGGTEITPKEPKSKKNGKPQETAKK